MLGAIAAGKANSLPVRHSASGSSRHYPKGASVLYMLQHILGKDNFKRSIQLYLQRHSFATVETWDLQKAIIDATGINMDWFFDQWIHRGGEPKFKITTNNAVVNGEKGIEFTIEQMQKMDPVVGTFKMPVDFALYFTDGSVFRKTIMIDKAFQKVFIPTKNKDIAFK
jgi:aminopeptidase N